MSTNFQTKQCEQIKSFVEQFSGLENIGIKSRETEIADMKKIYCKLCDTYTKASLTTIGYVLRDSYTHASVLNSITKFDNLFQTGQISNIKVYHKIKKIIEKLDFYNTKESEDITNDNLIHEYIAFLEWFRKQVEVKTIIDSSFFVGKYFAFASKD